MPTVFGSYCPTLPELDGARNLSGNRDEAEREERERDDGRKAGGELHELYDEG